MKDKLILIPLFIIAFAIFYYLVLFIPKKQKFIQDAENVKQEEIKRCIREANSFYGPDATEERRIRVNDCYRNLK